MELRPYKSRFGSTEWIDRSTPGSQVLEQHAADDVTGTVVDALGKPIAGAKLFVQSGESSVTDDQGKFQVRVSKGTQFILHTFQPGYHVWFGTPTAGDMLKIVLEEKTYPREVPPPGTELERKR